MAAPARPLLARFRRKDRCVGVTRATVKALARRLDISQTKVVHLAPSRLAEETLPGYEADEGALTACRVGPPRKDAKGQMAKDKLLERNVLFE